MSPLIRTRHTGIADTLTIYPWQGNQYEILPFDALIEVAIVADAGDSWLGSVYSGSDVLMQGADVDILATAEPIVYPDYFLLSDVAAFRERISAALTNITGGVADARTACKITPL